MPISTYAQRAGTKPSIKRFKFPSFAKGANNFADDNEIRNDEFYQGQNIELVGIGGVRLPRRGTEELTEISGLNGYDGVAVYKNQSSGTNVLILWGGGKTYKWTGSGTPTDISGSYSWTSGNKMRGAIVRENLYFGNGVEYLSKYDDSSVSQWTYVSKVTGLSATAQGTTGSTQYEYTVTAVTDSGETEKCTNVTITNGNETLDSSNYNRLTWDRKTDSSVTGYNVYGRTSDGNGPMLLTFVDQPSSGSTVTYDDKGTETPSTIFFPPTFNTTGGVKASLLTDYKDSIIASGVSGQPDILFYSGVQENWETFSPAYGGGWIRIRAGDGDKVTALINYEDYVIVFKGWSIHKFDFGGTGGAPRVSSLLFDYGTQSPDTVMRVQNDIFFFGSDKKIRVLGYEPNILNMIRTTDISNRISDRLDAIDFSTPENIHAVFFEDKYILCDGSYAYPYDRRYLAFLDVWTNFNYSRLVVWDGIGNERRLYGLSNSDGKIYRVLKDNTYDDNGSAINAYIRTRNEDGGEFWRIKTWLWCEFRFKHVQGEVNIKSVKDGTMEIDTASVSSASPAGIGYSMVGEFMVGSGGGSTPEASSRDAPKRKEYFIEARTMYWEISVNSLSSRATLQSIEGAYEIEDVDYVDSSRII